MKIISILNIIFLIFIIMFNMIGCKIKKFNIIQNLDIKQGIYLNKQDIQKIRIGLNKSEIYSIIGSPVLKDLCNPNIWYYIYIHYYPNGQFQIQTIILTFDINDILILINELR